MRITRKQAVLRAIEVLSESKENYEICKVLGGLAAELPLSHWTEDSILDATNQFLNEHGRLPAAVDFIKVDYNGKQYEYTNKTDIKNLLDEVIYWYIEFNEKKKNRFAY